MTKWNRQCHEVNINHDQMVELNKEGSLNLLIVDSLEKQIYSLAQNESKNISSGYKLTKRKIIALGVLGVSFYFGINESWGWLGIGLIAAVIIVLKKENNNTNIIDLAIKDAEFFERVKEMKGWTFQIEEGKEKEYLVRPAEEDNDDESGNSNEVEEENSDDDDEIDKDFVKWVDKRVKAYGDLVEADPGSTIDIVDTSELPYPKEEMLDALIVMVILGEDVDISALSMAALDLANYQDNVGPKRLGATGFSTPDLLEIGASISKYEQMNEKEKNALKNTITGNENEEEQQRYTEFEALVFKETQTIEEKLELAVKLRHSSHSDRLKGVYTLTNLPKSITGKKDL